MPQADTSNTLTPSSTHHTRIAPTLLGNYVEERQAFEAEMHARDGQNRAIGYAHEEEAFHPRRHQKNRNACELAPHHPPSPKRVAATLLANWVEERFASEAADMGIKGPITATMDDKMHSSDKGRALTDHAVWTPTPAIRQDPHFHIKHPPHVTLHKNWFEDRHLLEEAANGRPTDSIIGTSGKGDQFQRPRGGDSINMAVAERGNPKGNHKAPLGQVLLANFVEERAVADKGFKDPEDLPTLSKAGHQGILAQSTDAGHRELVTTMKAAFQATPANYGKMGRRQQLLEEEFARMAASEIKEPVEDRSAKDWISTAKKDFAHDDIYAPVEDLGSKPVDESLKRAFAQPISFWSDQARLANGIAFATTPAVALSQDPQFGRRADFSTTVHEYRKGPIVQFTPIL
ncbi:hypothetical protein SeLEV6574_g01041 [Synchytrium endobioticum]|uniref:Uncharacterized protein n=1 Tax=Synchytrium endobioticum TaxID=286115 RepID=A0A507DFL5_9FUNG|nr:hypothetical protein SeLEV6574_g01041 [Synchytrium endobioticum]